MGYGGVQWMGVWWISRSFLGTKGPTLFAPESFTAGPPGSSKNQMNFDIPRTGSNETTQQHEEKKGKKRWCRTRELSPSAFETSSRATRTPSYKSPARLHFRRWSFRFCSVPLRWRQRVKVHVPCVVMLDATKWLWGSFRWIPSDEDESVDLRCYASPFLFLFLISVTFFFDSVSVMLFSTASSVSVEVHGWFFVRVRSVRNRSWFRRLFFFCRLCVCGRFC